MDKLGVLVSTLTKTKRYAVESVKHHLGDYTIDTLSHKVITAFLEKLQSTQIPQPENKTKSHPLYDGDRPRTYSPGSARKLFYALKTAVEWHAHEYHYPLGDKFEAVEVPAAWASPRDRRLNGDEEARLTGHTELETLKRYANLRPAILASKLDGVGLPTLC